MIKDFDVSNLAALPVFFPLMAGLLGLLLTRPNRSSRVAVAVVLVTLTVLCAWIFSIVWTEGVLVLRLGGWVPPFGIVLVVDTLAASMLVLVSLTALACVLYGFAETDSAEEHPMRSPLVLFLLTGINMTVTTGDLFNLFVAFEVMVLSCFALLTLEATDRNVRHALPYVMINAMGSMLFLAACGLAYSLFGTLSFAEIIRLLPDSGGDYRVTLLALMLMGVFGIKAGMFPLYYWLPAAYPILPAPMMALFGGLITKVAIYVMMRIFGTVLPADLTGLHHLLAVLGVITMFTGVLGAVSQYSIQRILSFHIVSQIGYMLLAVGLFTGEAWAAGILFLGHNILVKTSLFLVGGTVTRINGTDELAGTGNLWKVAPLFGVMFLVQALSLAGLPPWSGFWGKLWIVMAGFEKGAWVLIGLAVAGSILTLMSMMKIWLGAFWKTDEKVPARIDGRAKGMMAATLILVAASVWVGLGANGFLGVARQAAGDALNRDLYAERVFAAGEIEFEGKHRP